MEESRRGELLGTRTESLKVRLGALERHERQVQLVEATERRHACEASQRQWKDESKAELERLTADITAAASECFRLARIIKTGEEVAQVAVEDHIDGSTVYTVRMDTGEVIATRKASDGELQRSLLPAEGGLS
jgi:endonuclease YncB( thermonuclease family)